LAWIAPLVGLALLVLGRRLYWVFVAGVGFVTGLTLAPRLLPHASELTIAVVAVALAVAGALVALLAQAVAVGITGFLAGGAIAALLLRNIAHTSDAVAFAVYVAAGIVGVALSLMLFDSALILLSSLAGAALLAGSAARAFRDASARSGRPRRRPGDRRHPGPDPDDRGSAAATVMSSPGRGRCAMVERRRARAAGRPGRLTSIGPGLDRLSRRSPGTSRADGVPPGASSRGHSACSNCHVAAVRGRGEARSSWLTSTSARSAGKPP